MKSVITLMIFILLGLFTSCDFFIQNDGYVKDIETKEPINCVKVQLLLGKNKRDTCDLIYNDGFNSKEDPLLTDSNGYFRFGRNTGMRPNYFYIRFSKKGYNDLILNGDSIKNHSTLEIFLSTTRK
jgi:hypothetical protein